MEKWVTNYILPSVTMNGNFAEPWMLEAACETDIRLSIQYSVKESFSKFSNCSLRRSSSKKSSSNSKSSVSLRYQIWYGWKKMFSFLPTNSDGDPESKIFTLSEAFYYP